MPTASELLIPRDISMPQPDAELARFAATIDYALVGVGAWGSCTSAAVRDGCSLVRLGKPVVVIVQEVFERAAQVHAAGLGCADLPICSYPHPSPGSPVDAQVMAGLAQVIR